MCRTGLSQRRLSIDFYGIRRAISLFVSRRRARSRHEPRVRRDPPVRLFVHVSRNRLARFECQRFARRVRRILFSSLIVMRARNREFLTTLDGARATRRGPIRAAGRGGAARAGVGIQDSRRGKSRLVAREEPPFPFAREPAARPLRLDTAPLSSSTTAEILRESVG